MRAVILAALTAGALGLYGTASVSAAPVNGSVIGDAASTFKVTEVGYYYRRRYYRYYRPYRYYRYGY
jgi:hypothetical protein